MGFEAVSLWECLHDGELMSCNTNHLERTVTLEFSVDHLDLNVLLTVDEVASVRAIGHFRRVGKFDEPDDISPEELTRLIEEYRAKWREESVTWLDFELALSTDPLQIMDANFVTDEDSKTLRLGGFLNGEKFNDIYFDVFVRGKDFSITRSDGDNLSLESFRRLGRKYWEEM